RPNYGPQTAEGLQHEKDIATWKAQQAAKPAPEPLPAPPPAEQLELPGVGNQPPPAGSPPPAPEPPTAPTPPPEPSPAGGPPEPPADALKTTDAAAESSEGT